MKLNDVYIKHLSGRVKPYSSWEYNQTIEFHEPKKMYWKGKLNLI